MNKQSAIRNPRSAIAIVGAGPAGSSLAIRLAQAGFVTTLIEKEKFPRQKLCGEFISPECLTHFNELGVTDSMLQAGGDRIFETRFFETGGRSVLVPSGWFGASDGFALGLSRAEMDLRLLERAKEVGVEVHEGSTLTDVELEGGRVTKLRARSEDRRSIEIHAEVFVDATGRARSLARLTQKKNLPDTQRPQIVGFKTHITGAEMERGVCEIYSFPGGYAGLSHVEGDVANLCFLIKSDVVRSIGKDAGAIVDSVVMQNRRAAETLRNCTAGDWLAVSITGFGTKRVAPANNIFSVGDAAAFIDPFTGSGMVMAMESAKILANVIERSWASLDEAGRRYELEYRRRFARRLRICSVLRRSAFMPRLATAMVGALGISTSARRILARATRG